jgi:hypothetical protein
MIIDVHIGYKLISEMFQYYIRFHVPKSWLLKSDSTHHFFRNACTKSGSLRFSQFSGCWLILSVYIIMSLDFPFVRLFDDQTQDRKLNEISCSFQWSLFSSWNWTNPLSRTQPSLQLHTHHNQNRLSVAEPLVTSLS